MVSQRIQQRIERLLEEADDGIARSDWATVRDRALNVLALDRENADAKAYLEAAGFRLGHSETLLGEPTAQRDPSAMHPAGKTAHGGTGEGVARAPSPAAGVEQSHPSSPVPHSFINGRYTVKRFLGEGGKKRVYLALDTMLARDVAFALIKTEGLDAEGRERITREAQAMGRLGAHPHIVAVFDTSVEGGSPLPEGEGQGEGVSGAAANFARIPLRGLTVDEVHRMMVQLRGQEVPWGRAEAIHRQTEGNPLFIQEVLRYLVEEGLVVREGGRWVRGDDGAPESGIPEGLRDVIGKRLSRLSPECNRILALAAVAGRDFDLDVLHAVGAPAAVILREQGLGEESGSGPKNPSTELRTGLDAGLAWEVRLISALEEAVQVGGLLHA